MGLSHRLGSRWQVHVGCRRCCVSRKQDVRQSLHVIRVRVGEKDAGRFPMNIDSSTVKHPAQFGNDKAGGFSRAAEPFPIQIGWRN